MPDGDKVMVALNDAKRRGIFGPHGFARIVWDDRKDRLGNWRGDLAAAVHRKSHKSAPPGGAVRV